MAAKKKDPSDRRHTIYLMVRGAKLAYALEVNWQGNTHLVVAPLDKRGRPNWRAAGYCEPAWELNRPHGPALKDLEAIMQDIRALHLERITERT